MSTIQRGDPAMRDHLPSHLIPRTRSVRFDVVRGSLITLLTVATAIALFTSGWILSNPAVVDPRPAGAETIVRDFYAAVNQTIRSGDASALNASVEEHAETHGPLATIAPSRDGLSRYLLSLHATTPQLELRVTGMAITGSRAVVDVDVTGAEEGSFLGSSLREVAPWSAVDGLRIGNGRVLEFWSEATGLALLESQRSAPVSFGLPTDRRVSLDRVTIAPEDRLLAEGKEDLHWLLGESNHLTVTTTPNPTNDSPEAEPNSHETRLHTGELLALPTWSHTEIRNTGLDPASLLVLTVAGSPDSPFYDSPTLTVQSTSETSASWPKWKTGVTQRLGGATFTTLTGGISTALPKNQAFLAVAHVTLAPGAVFSGIALSGPCLIVVDTGKLDLFARGEPAWIYQGSAEYHNSGTLAADTGALLPNGAVTNLHNPGASPTVVTLFALLPADATTGGNA
jgi:hypothetical protein